MALIVVKDRTEELTDAIFEGASTKEEARITAKEFQDDIEFEFNNKLREIQEEKQDQEEADDLEDQRAERKADRQDLVILRFVYPRPAITEGDDDNDYPSYRRGVYHIGFKNHLERATDRSVSMTREADPIDTEDELEYETQDKDYLNEYTVRLDPEFEEYISIHRYVSPLPTFTKATNGITDAAVYVEYTKRLLASGMLQNEEHVVKLLHDTVTRLMPRRSKRRRVSSGRQ